MKEEEKTATRELTFRVEKDLDALYGELDRNLKVLEEEFNVRVRARGNRVTVEGEAEAVEGVSRVLMGLDEAVAGGYALRPGDVAYAVRAYRDRPGLTVSELFRHGIPVASKKRFVVPKNETQRRYLEAIASHDLVIGIGPAGTGKTYLAMAMAVASLLKQEVSRIILVRPAVEAGERLGFLPGDLVEKVNPYLRPLYDALYDMMEAERAGRLIERGSIEVAPLAFMRGRTLNDSFIILDEAQNTTREQMKMFLTRLGFNSKTVVTGDVTQVDLPPEKGSGLIEAQRLLAPIEEIAIVYFTDKDVVRHRLVQRIIQAYEQTDSGPA
ncbi:MAG: hypothetical protein A2V83_08300 [Nitrospirae bacterium RBG_16_64_22]|nr:MAG: hypothetical protein A2V83_08300 [Nitrospirae bacterium RBG_16_64_22]